MLVLVNCCLVGGGAALVGEGDLSEEACSLMGDNECCLVSFPVGGLESVTGVCVVDVAGVVVVVGLSFLKKGDCRAEVVTGEVRAALGAGAVVTTVGFLATVGLLLFVRLEPVKEEEVGRKGVLREPLGVYEELCGKANFGFPLKFK